MCAYALFDIGAKVRVLNEHAIRRRMSKVTMAIGLEIDDLAKLGWAGDVATLAAQERDILAELDFDISHTSPAAFIIPLAVINTAFNKINNIPRAVMHIMLLLMESMDLTATMQGWFIFFLPSVGNRHKSLRHRVGRDETRVWTGRRGGRRARGSHFRSRRRRGPHFRVGPALHRRDVGARRRPVDRNGTPIVGNLFGVGSRRQ
jgi:hypothetical protein